MKSKSEAPSASWRGILTGTDSITDLKKKTFLRQDKPIAITLGDPSGIGAEVTARALKSPQVSNLCDYLIIGDPRIYEKYGGRLTRKIIFADPHKHAHRAWAVGKATRESGQASLDYLDLAITLLKKKEISALVTAPICKESIAKILPNFQGHTEYLAQAFGVRHPEMMFVADSMRTVIVTRHIPITHVSKAITKRLVVDAIAITNQSLKTLFKIRSPRIAICGLNPHAGEGGLIGKEEQRAIIPAIQEAKRKGAHVYGPFAADTIYTKRDSYDAIIAMYHDQGLAPIKTLHFKKVVNLTLGLPFIRTSPSHGTAFDIAGKNKADASSMIEAIKLAHQLSSAPRAS